MGSRLVGFASLIGWVGLEDPVRSCESCGSDGSFGPVGSRRSCGCRGFGESVLVGWVQWA